jgi:hypothetical protein
MTTRAARKSTSARTLFGSARALGQTRCTGAGSGSNSVSASMQSHEDAQLAQAGAAALSEPFACGHNAAWRGAQPLSDFLVVRETSAGAGVAFGFGCIDEHEIEASIARLGRALRRE